MENEVRPSPWKHALTYGSLTAVATFVYSLILYLLDLSDITALSYVGYLIMLVGLVLAMLHYKKNFMDGFMTYGQAFGIGFKTGLMMAIIGAVLGFILYQFIATDLPQQILDRQYDELLKNPALTDEQIEMTMSWSRKFVNPVGLAIGGFINYIIATLVISLLAAIFIKKDPA